MGKETRSAIIQLAREFLRRGEDLSVKNLVKRLGISKPAFYYHFRNKNELLSALGEPPSAAKTNRQRILEAALEAFATRGYTAASLDEIARDAGMTKSNIYWHFNSKEDLLRAVVAEHLAPGLRQWLTDHCDLSDGELVRRLLSFLDNYLHSRPALVRIAFVEAHRFPREVLKVLRTIVQEVVDILDETIQDQVKKGTWREVDPAAAAGMLVLPLMVHTLLQGLEGDFPELAAESEGTLAAMASIFLDGVRLRA